MITITASKIMRQIATGTVWICYPSCLYKGPLQTLSSVEKAGPVQVQFMLRLWDQWSVWMQDGCKVYMDSYTTSNGSCFMVTLTIGVMPNTKPGDHGTPNAHNRWLIYFIMCEGGPAWIDIHWNSSIWLRPNHIWIHNYTRGSVTTLHGFGGAVGQPLDTTFFWALTISWSRLLARVEP